MATGIAPAAGATRRRRPKGDRVIRVALPGDRRHLMSVKDAAVEKDFYLVEREDGRKHDEVKKALGRLEALAAMAMRQILTGEAPSRSRVKTTCGNTLSSAVTCWSSATPARRARVPVAGMRMREVKTPPTSFNHLQAGREPRGVLSR
jgi:hypothetical protein